MQVVVQTLKQGFEEGNLKVVKNLAQDWRSRLGFDCPEQSAATRESIIGWLLGNDLDRFEMLNQQQLKIAQQSMEYRYRILRQRYLGIDSEQADRNLMQRLGSVVLLRNKIRTFVAYSRDRGCGGCLARSHPGITAKRSLYAAANNLDCRVY